MPKILYICLLCTAISACEKDDINANRSPWEASLDREGPVVSCEDAFPGWKVTILPAPQPQVIHDVDFLNGEVGFIAGNEGYLGLTTDGAETWTRFERGFTNASLKAVVAVNRDTVYAAGGWERVGSEQVPGAIMLHTTDGGSTLSKRNLDTIVEVRDLYFEDGESGYAIAQVDSAGQPPSLFRVTDAGETWTLLDKADTFWLLEFAEVEGRLAAVGIAGMLLHTADGSEWEPISFPTSFRWGPFFDGGSIGFGHETVTSFESDTLFRTTDGGRNWNPVPGPVPSSNLSYLAPDGHGIIINPRYEVIGGDVLSPIGLHIYTTVDAGLSWELRKTSGNCGLGTILWEITPDKVLGIGPETLLLERDN
ncbi:MAG: hypothetical protein WA952_16790 [Lewinella sp.]